MSASCTSAVGLLLIVAFAGSATFADAGLAAGATMGQSYGPVGTTGDAEERMKLQELSEEELLAPDDADDDATADEPQLFEPPWSEDDSANSSTGEDPSTASPHLIRLRRESVPIYRRGKIASFKTSYSGILHIGTPAQEFRVVFDTGSGNVVVPASGCQSESCLVHRRFNITESSTATAVMADGMPVQDGEAGDQVTIGFGTGEITGEFVRDRLCIISEEPEAENSSDGLAVANGSTGLSSPCVEMNIIMSVEMSTQPFKTFNFDGILGLGLDALTMGEGFSTFGMLSRLMPGAPRFSAFLTDGEAGEESEMAFGGYNPARLLEPLSWAPVAMPEMGYWQIEILAVRINGVELEVCQDGTCRGVVDTGTSHLGVPAPHNVEFEQLLKRSAGDLLDCRLADAPEIEFELRGFNITVHPATYMRRLPLRADVSVGSVKGVHLESNREEPKPQAVSTAPVAPLVEVDAPWGPLGIAFDEEQTVVMVATYSPLQGKVKIGDVLRSINGNPTTGLTGAELATVLAKLRAQARALQFSSPAAVREEARALQLREQAIVAAVSGGEVAPIDEVASVVVDAPSGSLGIAFGDDVGRVVVKMDSSSPLRGQVQVGDELVTINSVSTMGLTGKEIAASLAESNYGGRSLGFVGGAAPLKTDPVAVAATTVATEAPAAAPAQEVAEASEEDVERFCSPRLLPVRLPEPLGPKLFILGEPVLHRYYTVYDWQAQSIGFGLANTWRNTMNPAELADPRGVLPDGVDKLLMQQTMTTMATVRRSRPTPEGDSEDEVIMLQVRVNVAFVASVRQA